MINRPGPDYGVLRQAGFRYIVPGILASEGERTPPTLEAQCTADGGRKVRRRGGGYARGCEAG
eukprot:747873-Hanusia_phi.AAC.1